MTTAKGKVNPTVLGVAALVCAVALLVWKVHSRSESSRSEEASLANDFAKNASAPGTTRRSASSNKRERTSIDKTDSFIGEIERIIRLHGAELQSFNGIDQAEVEQLYGKLKKFAQDNNISDRALHDIFLFNIGRDYPEVSFALASYLDPGGTGATLQDVTLRTMIGRNDVSDIFAVMSQNGPSGKSLEALISSNLDKILAQDPKGLIEWVNRNSTGDFSECINKNLTRVVGRINLPSELRIKVLEDSSTPKPIREMALIAESKKYENTKDVIEWNQFVEKVTKLEMGAKSTEVLIGAWPFSDIDGASKFLSESDLDFEIGRSWNRLLGRSLQQGDHDTIARIIKDPNGQELTDSDLASAAAQIYLRDKDIAANLFSDMKGSSSQELKFRKYIFERAISQEKDMGYLQKLIKMESNPERREEMRRQLERQSE
jgi:hypothetical protein